MAFKNAPTQDTYSQIDIPVCYDLMYSNRGIADSIGMTNLVPVKYPIGGESMLVSKTRPNIGATLVDSGSGNGKVMRGVYAWQKTSSDIYYFAVCGTSVYTSTNIDGPYTAVTTLATSATTPVGFTEFINSATNAKSLVLLDGVEGFVFTSDAAGTEIVDADFPTPHLPFPVYLDGYLFVAKPDTGDIYNSDLNSATAWTAGSFVSSELYPDDLKAIIKVNNYLLAVGTQGSEYFYDAANATGSPLRRVDGASLPFGTHFPYSIASNKNMAILLANTNDGNVSFKKIENMQATDLSSNDMLDWIQGQSNAFNGGLGENEVWGSLFKSGDDLFYVLSVDAGVSANVTRGKTLCFSTLHNMWSEWTLTNSSSTVAEADQISFPGKRFASLGTAVVGGNFGGDPFIGSMSYASPGIGADFGTAQDQIGTTEYKTFWQIRTPWITFGTLNRKFISKLGLNAEVLSANTFTQIQALVDWADNDDGWRGQDREISSSSSYEESPFVRQLGMARRRRFKVSHPNSIAFDNEVIFLGLEASVNKGNT